MFHYFVILTSNICAPPEAITHSIFVLSFIRKENKILML